MRACLYLIASVPLRSNLVPRIVRYYFTESSSGQAAPRNDGLFPKQPDIKIL